MQFILHYYYYTINLRYTTVKICNDSRSRSKRS